MYLLLNTPGSERCCFSHLISSPLCAVCSLMVSFTLLHRSPCMLRSLSLPFEGSMARRLIVELDQWRG